jgi:hypothetical protein
VISPHTRIAVYRCILLPRPNVGSRDFTVGAVAPMGRDTIRSWTSRVTSLRPARWGPRSISATPCSPKAPSTAPSGVTFYIARQLGARPHQPAELVCFEAALKSL